MRNVLIAIGNSGEPTLVGLAEERLADPSPLVRAMAVWALAATCGTRRHGSVRSEHRRAERDPAVLAEWRDALA